MSLQKPAGRWGHDSEKSQLGFLLVLAASGAGTAGSSPKDSVVEDNVQGTTTTTSSTMSPYCDISERGQCTFDVVLPDGGSFQDLLVEIRDSIRFDGIGEEDIVCRIARSRDPRLEGARVSDADSGYGYDYLVDGVSQELPAGTRLLSCEAEAWSSMCASDRYDFLAVQAFSQTLPSSGALTGIPDAPRTCIADFQCYGQTVYSVPEPRCGDANWDQRVTAGDALAALRTSVGLSSCRFAASCDANGDQRVGAEDALAILRAVVRAPVSLACPLPCSEEGPFDVVADIESLPIRPAHLRFVSLRGGRFAPHRDHWKRTTIQDDGSAVVEASPFSDSIVVTFHSEGVRPRATDLAITAVSEDGSTIEGAIRSVKVEFARIY